MDNVLRVSHSIMSLHPTNLVNISEAKLICCFTGQATQKVGSVDRQKNKNKG